MAAVQPYDKNNENNMYQDIVTINTCRRQAHRQHRWQLSCALLLALTVHTLLLTELGNPIEKHDVPLPHRVSLLEVELVSAATASELPPQPVLKQTTHIQKKGHPREQTRRTQQVKKKAIAIHTARPDKTSTPAVSEKRPSVVHHHIAIKKPAPLEQPRASAQQEKIHHPKPASAATVLKKQPVVQQKPPQINRKKLQQHYLARIMRLIKRHKSYPYSARKRHMEDHILISFTVDLHGVPSHIQIHGKHTLLERASRQAIRASLPFPPIPKALGNNVRIEFTMQYQLSHS